MWCSSVPYPNLQHRLDQGGEREFYEREADKAAERLGESKSSASMQPVTTVSLADKPVSQGKDDEPIQHKRKNPFKKLGEAVKKAGKAIKEKVVAVAKKAAQVVKKAAKAVGKAIKKFKDLKRQALLWILKKLGPTGQSIAKLIEMAQEAKEHIFKDPKKFFQNLGKTLGKGFAQFRDNFKKHFINGIFNWLTGGMAGEITLPEKWDLRGIFSLLLQVMGLTLQNVKRIFGEHLGAKNVDAIESFARGNYKEGVMNLLMSNEGDLANEKANGGGAYAGKNKLSPKETADAAVTDETIQYIEQNAGSWIKLFKDIKEKGPIAIWDFIKDKLSDLKATFIKTITEIVLKQVIIKVVAIIATSSNPAGAILRVIITIWRILVFIIRKLEPLIELVRGILGTFIDIGKGAIATAATGVEMTLARFIPLAIDLVLSIIGLGNLPKRIVEGIKKIRSIIEKPIVAVAKIISKVLRPIFDFVRKAIIKVKAIIGKGIGVVKGGVETIKEKGKELYEKGKEKVTGLIDRAFQPKWSKARDAVENRHKSEVGAHLSEDEKKEQGQAGLEIDSIFDKHLTLTPDLSAMNKDLDTLKGKFKFSRLEAVEEGGKFVVKFGFSELSFIEKGLEKGLEFTISKFQPGGSELWSSISKLGEAKNEIVRHPVNFLTNLSKGAHDGFISFTGGLKDFIKEGFFDWLAGASSDIRLPARFDAKGIFQLIIDIAGLGFNRVVDVVAGVFGVNRNYIEAVVRFVKQEWKEGIELILGATGAVSSPVVNKITETISKDGGEFYNFIKAAKENGIGGIWDFIQTEGEKLKGEILTSTTGVIVTNVVGAVVKNIAALATPATAIAKLLLTVWNMIQFLYGNFTRMVSIINGFVSAFSEFAYSGVSTGAKIIVDTLKMAIPVAIDLLVKISGLGGIANSIKNKIKEFQEKIKSIIVNFANKVKEKAKILINKLRTTVGGARTQASGNQQANLNNETPALPPDQQQKLDAGLTSLNREYESKIADGEVTADEAKNIAIKVKGAHQIFTKLEVVDKGSDWEFDYVVNPSGKVVKKKMSSVNRNPKGTISDPIPIDWLKPRVQDYPVLYLLSKRNDSNTNAVFISTKMLQGDALIAKFFPDNIKKLPNGFEIGVSPENRPKIGMVIGPVAPTGQRTPGGEIFRKPLKTAYFFDEIRNEDVQIDHVLENQLGGPHSVDPTSTS
jgi:phage-related protein